MIVRREFCDICWSLGSAVMTKSMTSSLRTFTVVLITSLIMDYSLGFNVDTRRPMVHKGDRESMFGFAVAQHIDQDTSWILVGAPRTRTTQTDVDRGGAVYRCKISRANDCQRIPFDLNGNNIMFNGTDYVDLESKSHQWFGATVQSSGVNGLIVACAPRRVFFTKDLDKREPIGSCIVASSSNTFTEYSPCKNSAWGYHQQGHCMAGFSAAITNDQKSMLIGAVGSWYWQGQVFTYDLEYSSKAPSYSSPEGPPSHDNSYLGFSSAVGEFDGDGVSDYVVGIPRGNDLSGKITLLRRDLSTIANISGHQIGAYFGYSVAVVDLNGDFLDDIVVGAPFHSEYKTFDVYETGRIYIIYQNKTNGFRAARRDIIDGNVTRSRFGFSISSLNDINYDGYKDLAVGAPYGGKDRRGTVHIFHGSPAGILTTVSQIIEASHIDKSITTFGYSISAGQDMDNNGYPDVLIGAYSSDKAVFLRSRPVVRVGVAMNTSPRVINLEVRDCSSFSSSAQYTCLNVRTCIEYHGFFVPDKLKLNITWELDSSKKGANKRAYYLTAESPSIISKIVTLEKKESGKSPLCVNHYAYVKNKIRDKLSPIEVTFKFQLHTTKKMRRKRDVLPMLDGYISTTSKTQADIGNNCDDVCVPDLVVSAHSVAYWHVIGATDLIQLDVMVGNRGEDSFLSTLYVELPAEVQYHRIRNSLSWAVRCDLESDGSYVVCDLGNPLPRQYKLEFSLLFLPGVVNDSTSSLVFSLNVNSTNPEKFSDTTNNFVTVTIPLVAEADYLINGASYPNPVLYNLTSQRTRLDPDGISVMHLYEIQNNGPSTLSKTQVRVLWPSHLKHGDPLLMLESLLVSRGSGSCQVIPLTPSNASDYVDSEGMGLRAMLDEHISFSKHREKRSTRTEWDHRDSDDSDYVDDHVDDHDDDDIIKIMCSPRWCTLIVCELGRIEAGGNMLLQISSSLSTATLVKYSFTSDLRITSLMVARALEMPYSADVNITALPQHYHNISTGVNSVDVKPKPKGVAIWIIAVAISCGLLLLLLLIVLLWWCGFFKRKRIDENMANQKNGKMGH